MKKTILALAVVAIAATATSCGKKAAAAYDDQEKNLGDTLSLTYGEFMGARANSEVDRQLANMSEEQKNNFDRAAFMRGLKAAATQDTTELAYIMGLQYGMNLWGAAKGIPADMGIPADAAIMVEAFEKVFNADSIGDIYTYQGQFQEVMTRAQEYAEAKELRQLEEAPEAIENKAAGAAYADKLVADSAYTRTESGLVYKITQEGTGDKVKANDRIQLNYVGKHLDGSIFDQTNGTPMNSFANRFIPGFSEGLQLLSKGGKATLVIPGDIAYGVRGHGDIKSNETLIFEIEIVDIFE